MHQSHALVAIVTLLVVAFVGVEQGIFLAIILSLIDRLRRQYHPHDEVLLSEGKVIPRLESRVKAPAPGQLDDVLVYRFSAPLFFENATYFGERVRADLAATGTARVRRRAGPDGGVRGDPSPGRHHRDRRRRHRRAPPGGRRPRPTR